MELITVNTFVTYKISITLWEYFLVGKYENLAMNIVFINKN